MTEITLIDKDRLMKEFSGDEEILADVCQLFEMELPKMMRAIETAIVVNDMKALELNAHTLKGAVANFQAPKVKDAAFHLEKQGRENNPENANESLRTLRTLTEALVRELHLLIHKAE